MQYTADELYGAGTPIKNILLAGGDYTFTIYRPPNTTGKSTSLSGSGYFTYETVRDANGFYSSTIDPLALGSQVSISGSNSLITSSYIFSYELNTNSNTPNTSSFIFTPDNDVLTGNVMFRATGDYDMYVSPEVEACGIQQNYVQNTPSYPTFLESILGSTTGVVTLTPVPFGIPDRWVIDWNGSNVIDTGYISTSPTLYNEGGNRRITYIQAGLIGKQVPELAIGQVYPQPQGGTFPNVIASDGYPVINPITAAFFSKDAITSVADVKVYGPFQGTAWSSTLSCPVPSAPYTFTDRTELKTAVDLWESDRTAALATYGEINTWVVSAVQTMTDLFKGMTTFNSDISNWDMTGTDDTLSMFQGADSFNQPLNSWDMSNVTDMGLMFKGAIAFDQPLNDWNVSGVFDCDEMFSGATAFNQDIKSWNTSNFFSLFEFFLDATSFNQDISNWDVSSVTNAAAMFTGAGTFSTNNYDLLLEGWSTQTLQNAVVFGVGTTQYSSGAPTTARGVLTSAPNNWVITDGGQVPVTNHITTQGGDSIMTQNGDHIITN